MNKINEFFINTFNQDLSDTKVFFISLNNKAGVYNNIDDEVYINSDYNSITKELTIVHEYTHRMIALNDIQVSLTEEEDFCKYVTLEYIRQFFGEEAIALVQELI